MEILGMAVAAGSTRTPPMPGHCGFWLDRQRRPHVGTPEDLASVREGVAGFAQLVKDGLVSVPPGGPIHPRTALGLDASGRRLLLVVVDGRQKGYSEGMDNHELACYMRGLGCRDAMNLDGGGSSIMILRDGPGQHRVVNDPCTKANGVSVPRPIPVGLIVRQRR